MESNFSQDGFKIAQSPSVFPSRDHSITTNKSVAEGYGSEALEVH